MKKQLGFILLASLLAAPLTFADVAGAPSGTYGVDKNHAYITFSYLHHGFSNPHVGFDNFDATLELDSENVENSSLTVDIDANSINSRVEIFNEHLRGEDFFDTANHPGITFVSTGMKSTGENTYAVEGDLTIKGVTKAVTLDTTINRFGTVRGTQKLGVSAETKVMRSEWGLTNGLPNVSDEVTLLIEVEMPKI